MNCVYNFDGRNYYYDYYSEFETDGYTTVFKPTTKFLGNYGLKPIAVTPMSLSSNSIEVDLGQYLETKPYTVSSTDETEYLWYFLTPNFFNGKQMTNIGNCNFELGDYKFQGNITLSGNSISLVEMTSDSTKGNLVHIDIKLRRQQ